MTWDSVRLEIAATQGHDDASPFDVVRRAKISAVEEITGIPLVIYAVDFTDEGRAAQHGSVIQIELSDKTGFMQALSDIPDGPLDVLVHSPGGSPSATESIVHLLRARFSPIRFLVPHTAKSAATMLALSGNEILIGDGGELGPIDPQLHIAQDQRLVVVPACAAIDQFRQIHTDVTKRPESIRGWLPILRQYGPSFLQECLNSIELSKRLAREWLETYMFHGEEEATTRADRVADWLADHNNFNSHSRPVWIEQLLGVESTLKIRRFRDIGPEFESAVLAVYWAIDVTFDRTPAFKIIEHQTGSAYVRLREVIGQQIVAGGPVQTRTKPKRARPNRRKR